MSRWKTWYFMLCAVVLAWVVSPAIAFAQEVVEDALPGLIEQLTTVINTPGPFRIIGIVAVAVSILMYVLKSDKPPFNLIPKPPKTYQPFIAAGLGVVVSVLEAVIAGTAWVPAIITGVLSGAAAAFGYDVLKATKKDPTEEG